MIQRFLAVVVALVISSSSRAGDTWPEFRGPTGDGHSDATGLPVRWSETENIRWKTAIHDKGWSSPVIWGNQIWMTTARADGKEMFAVCVDKESGKILHDIKLFDVEKPGFSPTLNSYASPTPIIEPGRVYLSFGSYGTVCLDTATAKPVWIRRDLPCDHFRAPGSSPILYGNLVILNFDGFDFQYVVALDKQTGQTVWRRDRDLDYGTTNGDLKKAFGTPRVVDVHGRPELISPSAAATEAFDPLTGKEIWRVYHGGMNAAARPIFYNGTVVVTTGDGGTYKMLAINPDGHGDATKDHIVWTQNRGIPSRCSPLLVGNRIYFVNEGGIATCLSADNGKLVWQKRLGGQFSSSPVYADGRMVWFDQDGTAWVLAPGDEPKVLVTNRLDDGCMASPAVVGRAIYVRTRTHLYRIEKRAN